MTWVLIDWRRSHLDDLHPIAIRAVMSHDRIVFLQQGKFDGKKRKGRFRRNVSQIEDQFAFDATSASTSDWSGTCKGYFVHGDMCSASARDV